MMLGISLLLVGCATINNEDARDEKTAVLFGVNEQVDQEMKEEVESEAEANNDETKEIAVDYSAYFGEKDGCVVIYNTLDEQYYIYNKEQVTEVFSPCSTFKIISALIGIEEQVLSSIDTKMNYGGDFYSIDSWNSDLTLQGAFKNSCVWYFRKVLDQVGEKCVKAYLEVLGYGNCDVSEWQGSGVNATEDTNGFWLESSLKISPIQQVQVLYNLFEIDTQFNSKSKKILKTLMYIDTINSYEFYGKTGTGNQNAWFVGFVQKEDIKYYFAVHLGENNETNISGNDAREIAQKVVQNF